MSKRILFVDDSPMVLRQMQSMVEDIYQVDLATSCEQAFVQMEKEKPDLIFMDCEMPECNGKQSFELIHSDERYKDIPIVFLTSISDEKYILPIVALHPQGYLLKPPTPKLISDTIHNLIGE